MKKLKQSPLKIKKLKTPLFFLLYPSNGRAKIEFQGGKIQILFVSFAKLANVNFSPMVECLNISVEAKSITWVRFPFDTMGIVSKGIEPK